MIKNTGTFTEIIIEFASCIRRYGNSYANRSVGPVNNPVLSRNSAHKFSISINPLFISSECLKKIKNKVSDFLLKMGCSGDRNPDPVNYQVYLLKDPKF